MSFTALKTAFITGSSRGIGRGIATRLAADGVGKIAIHYHTNAEAANKTLSGIRELGADGFVIQGDVTKPGEITAMFSAVRERFGSLDLFVSNARPSPATFYQPPFELPVEAFRTAMDSQATAFFHGVREAVPLMGAGGRILAITYAPGCRTGSWQPWVAIGAAKAAMESLCRYFAVALAKRGITVNAISPGWVDDSVLNELPEEVQTAVKDWHVKGGWTPMGRIATPADIGDAVLLLASRQAGFITGQLIHVDGGASLMSPDLPMALQVPG